MINISYNSPNQKNDRFDSMNLSLDLINLRCNYISEQQYGK
jgi:hypothetical protein